MSLTNFPTAQKRTRLLAWLGALVFVVLIAVGVFAKNGWFPSTDAFTGKKTGWFGKPLAKNASSSWNPLAAPLPDPTPQLSKEYIYAGSRLLAVEDKNANAAPPADLAVWRPSSGVWWVLGGPGSAQTSYGWGMSGDVPVQGDFDGDGKTDFTIFRPSTGTWWVTKSSDGTSYSTTYGQNYDIPTPADFDGDGKTDVAVWRPSTQGWYILRSTEGAAEFTYGTTGDLPVPADYDGDGRADYAVWRNSNTTFYSLTSSTSSNVQTSLGLSGDECIRAGDSCVNSDYDGDGKADLAVWRSSNATWHVKQSSTGSTISTPYGASGDKLVPNDYDGDAKVDIAVWRPSNGNWYILRTTTGTTRQEAWGMEGDIPVPAFFRR